MNQTHFAGGNIKNLREQSGLSQAQLAIYLEVDQSLISRIEKNERQPNLEMIDKIAALFGCKTDVIESDEICKSPLQFAFRASEISGEDFTALAAINKIALNLREMKLMLGGEIS